MYKHFGKRLFDVVFASVAFLVFLPAIAIVLALLAIANNGQPFFFQLRPGRDEKLFTIIKFKTMNDRKDSSGRLLSDADRLTNVGRFVRKTSLDELPQLINVILGDMSLIGPRPLLPEYLAHYTNVEKRRHDVRPGITGLAQVKGRNQMKFSERLKNDVYYVDNLSFSLDFEVFLLTIKTILFKSKTVVHGQTVDEVDDIGLSRNLSSNHFNNKRNEHKG